MGYYDNPPLIDMNPGADQITAGILSASNSIAQGLLKRGERREQAEKEEALTLKKLAAQRNEVDLAYAESVSDWKSKTSLLGKGVDEGALQTIEKYNTEAADARIALLNESNPAKRKELLNLVTRANEFMQNTYNFAKALGGETATLREQVNSANFNQPGGYSINGPIDQLENRTMFATIMSGMDQTYSDVKIDYQPDGANFNISISAKDKSGKLLSYSLNSDAYLKADASKTGTFLQKVENINDFGDNVSKSLYDPKTGMYQTYLDQNVQTARVGGNKIYSGQLLNTEAVKAEIAKKADIKAKGYLQSGNEAGIRALVNYTLAGDPTYYDSQFKTLNADQKQKKLTDLFTERGFDTVTKELFTSDGPNKQKMYWGPDTRVVNEKIEKAPTASNGGGGLTANKQLALKEIVNKVKTEKEKLSKGDYEEPIESGNGKVRIVYDSTSKKWLKQQLKDNKWEDDLEYPPIAGKKKAAQKILGY